MRSPAAALCFCLARSLGSDCHYAHACMWRVLYEHDSTYPKTTLHFFSRIVINNKLSNVSWYVKKKKVSKLQRAPVSINRNLHVCILVKMPVCCNGREKTGCGGTQTKFSLVQPPPASGLHKRLKTNHYGVPSKCLHFCELLLEYMCALDEENVKAQYTRK